MEAQNPKSYHDGTEEAGDTIGVLLTLKEKPSLDSPQLRTLQDELYIMGYPIFGLSQEDDGRVVAMRLYGKMRGANTAESLQEIISDLKRYGSVNFLEEDEIEDDVMPVVETEIEQGPDIEELSRAGFPDI